MSEASRHSALQRHRQALAACALCPAMNGPPVMGRPVLSRVLLVGQAPGTREIVEHRPFAWTAGRTLFGWFATIGLEETAFRERVYMAAVCRCFPGKNPRGGDRVPNRSEVANCSRWLETELALLEPELVIPVGKLAIGRFLPDGPLNEVVGHSHRIEAADRSFDLIPLPHPSGASTWHRTEPGRTLLNQALALIEAHPAWQRLCSAFP